MLLGYREAQTQCTPDVVTCIDTASPGQICPEVLPDGIINETYSQVVTILPPYEFNFGNGIVPVVKIKLTDVENLPPGISYEKSAEEFYSDTAYCVLLTGIPTEAGQFDLTLHIVPTILIINEEVELGEIEDDTSLTITINPAAFVDDLKGDNEFYISEIDNHYMVNYYSKKSSSGLIEVFDICGHILYHQYISINTGFNRYYLNEPENSNGLYFIKLASPGKILTRKIIGIH